MLRIQRNSIYILLPLCVVSLIVSAIFNAIASPIKGWFTYGSNILIGIFGSSLLTLILAVIGYCHEKHLVYKEYFRKLEKMIFAISKYQQCDINNSETLNSNIELLKEVLYRDTCELGDIFAKFAFLWDVKRVISYLYGYYQYFDDIKELTKNNIHLLSENVKAQSVLDFIDKVLLNVSQTTYQDTTFIDVKNKVFEDLYGELDALIILANGRKDPKIAFFYHYKFNKTVLNEKIFKIENAEIERILHVFVELIEKENDFTISFTNLTDECLKYLWDNHYICGKTTTNEGTLISITVTNKAYRYFRFKEHYKNSLHNNSA